MMEIKKVTDISFKKYGRIVEGIDLSDIIEAAQKNTPMPADSVVYVPGDEGLEACKSVKLLQDNIYGGMPIQVGYCNGNNNKLNAVEYHRDSEINIACTDAILILGKLYDVADDFSYDTGLMEAFLIPAGTAVEVYATTLHYAPCTAQGEGFRVIVVLPQGTNLPKPEIKMLTAEDKLMTAANKWLIAHREAHIEGAFEGLTGENLTI